MASELLTLTVICSATLLGQVTADQLAKPPANSQNSTIHSTAGTGKTSTSVEGDGVNMTRQSFLRQGQIWEIDQAVKLGADGMSVLLVVRGHRPAGNAADNFGIFDGKAGRPEGLSAPKRPPARSLSGGGGSRPG